VPWGGQLNAKTDLNVEVHGRIIVVTDGRASALKGRADTKDHMLLGSIMKRLEALERSISFRRSRQIILEVDGNLPVDEAAEAESTALSSSTQ
jgi:hypothetical protein